MGRILACLSICASCYLFTDVAVVPDAPPCGITTFANYTYRGNDNDLTLWQLLHHRLKLRGEELLLTYARPNELEKLNSPSVSAIIFSNIPTWFGKNWKRVVSSLKAKKILICWEPPSVINAQYQPEILKLFDIVLTWNPVLVDNAKFRLFHYPDLSPMASSLVPFASRRLLTQICSNKKSSHPDELYSLRRHINYYFERHLEKDFQFFGQGWEREALRVWGGAIPDKRTVLQKFRFSICFENMKNIPGYVTEKIFDCMSAGCVPVYCGASNIEDYVPSGCFIRFEKFHSISRLYQHLEKMSEKRYQEYLKHIRAFLSSSKAKKFTRPACVAQIEAAIDAVRKPC